MSNEIKEFTVRLPAELADVIKQTAFASGQSVNELFKKAMTEYVTSKGRSEAVQAAFRNALTEHAEALKKLEHL